MKRSWWDGCALAGAALLLAACGGPKHPRAQALEAGSVEPGAFVQVERAGLDAQGAALVAQGSVAFDEERVAAIIPPVQGRVVRLLAAAGDHVDAGAPLAIVYSAEVAGAGAGLSEARIARIAAEQAAHRAERLASEGAGSQREVMETHAQLATAIAEERRATAALRALGAPSAATAATYTLRAPLAGTVVRRSLRVGSEARPDAAEPAFLIADLGHLWVLAYVHEAQAAAVRPGDRAEVELPALPGRRFEGAVERVADAVDPNTRTLVVRIGLDNPDHALKPEMFARVTLRTRAAGVVLLPTTALLTQREGYAVFVERTPGRFERRTVVVGAELDGHCQVLTGLRPGERVVTRGALLLDASGEQAL